MGLIHEGLGEAEKTIDYFDQSIAIVPSGALKTHRAILAYNEQGDYKRALQDCQAGIKSRSRWDKFGDVWCNDGFVERLKAQVKNNKGVVKPRAHRTKNRKLYYLMRNSMPAGCGNISCNIRMSGSETTIDLGGNLKIICNDSIGLVGVRMPQAVGDQIKYMARQNNYQVGADLSYPFLPGS